MPDYNALKTAIDADPAHAGRTDTEVAVTLNAPIPGHPRRIPLAELAELLDRRGLIVPLEEAAGKWGTPHTDPVVRRAARAALNLLDNPRRDDASAEDPQFLAGLDVLQNAGLLDSIGADSSVVVPAARNRADILALAATTTTAAEQIDGWNLPVTEHDVAHARSL